MILGFIGTGKISSSIIFGIFKSKLKIKRIYISSRNRNIAKKLSKSYPKTLCNILQEPLIRNLKNKELNNSILEQELNKNGININNLGC